MIKASARPRARLLMIRGPKCTYYRICKGGELVTVHTRNNGATVFVSFDDDPHEAYSEVLSPDGFAARFENVLI